MALIVITVQDTDNGAIVSLASEPQMDMSAPPAGEAQKLAHLMLGALPMNGPKDEAHNDVELLNAMSDVLDKAAALDVPCWRSTEAELPPDETPVLIVLNGQLTIGELRWEHPGYEDNFESHRYWDSPQLDGQGWDWHCITHWMPLPDAPQEVAAPAAAQEEGTPASAEVQFPM